MVQEGDACQVCHSGTMRVRTGKDGSKFLGCSGYPACRCTGRHTPTPPVLVDAGTHVDDCAVPPMIPARPIDCANPARAVIPEGTTTGKVQRCFELLLRLVLCEGCQDRRVSEVVERLGCQFDHATIESLRKASKQFTKESAP